MRIALFALVLAALGACNPNADKCAPALPGVQQCPQGTFIDTTTNDQLCLDPHGTALCRDGVQYCYLCSGPQFTDGCYVTNVALPYECVHDCSKC
jgi:hypothetical protein